MWGPAAGVAAPEGKVQDFNSLGNMVFQIIDPKFSSVLTPVVSFFTCGFARLSPDLVSRVVLAMKISFIKGGDRSCHSIS